MPTRMDGFFAAVSFLTRVPVRLRNTPDTGRAVPWYGMVGTLVGAVVGLVAAGLGELATPLVGAAVAVVAGMLLTGAFHEDGLADVADAFAGGWTTEQRLRILKDPLHGSYGVCALAGTIVVRAVSLGALAPAAAFASAVAAHALARAGAVGVMLAVAPAVGDGLGVDAARAVRRPAAVGGIAAAVAVAALATGWWVVVLVPVTAAGAVAVGALAVRKIGGITGDVLGAAEQVAECLLLVAAVALASRYSVWWR